MLVTTEKSKYIIDISKPLRLITEEEMYKYAEYLPPKQYKKKNNSKTAMCRVCRVHRCFAVNMPIKSLSVCLNKIAYQKIFEILLIFYPVSLIFFHRSRDIADYIHMIALLQFREASKGLS